MLATVQDNSTQRKSIALTASLVLHALLILFFIIYKITMAEEEQRSKRRNISALGELD